MTLKVSKALRNFTVADGSATQALSNCVIKYYTGTQPANADAAPTGTLLCTFSKSGGALTREVLATGTMTLTGGASGSVNSVTVNSIDILGAAVAFDTSLAVTATKVAAQINRNPQNYLFTASASGAVVTIKAKPGLGALPNTWAVSAGLTTITASFAAMASGVTAVNGLNWDATAVNGVLNKHPDEVWQGTAVAGGTVGWFRVEAAVLDAGGIDSTESIIRVDGAVATSGGEINMGNTTIVNAAVQTISALTIELPTL